MKRIPAKPWAIAPLLVALALPLSNGYADPHGHGHEHGDNHWHGDIRHFHEHDLHYWRGGHWSHSYHDGHWGWWWVLAGAWYFYPQPVYPYPDPYTPPVVVAPQNAPPAQAAPPTQYWYYCDAAKGYYPYVPSCPGGLALGARVTA